MSKFLSRFIRVLPVLGIILPNLNAAQPNILFIAVDDLKPVLGCYGDTIAITPEMDRLAARGTVFTNAHCQWPVCGPSRASLMTSLYPEANGVMDLKTDVRAKNPDVLTLPQHFLQNGYTTVGTGKIYDPRCVDNKKDQDKPSWSLPYARLPLDKIRFNDAHKVVMAPKLGDEELADGQIALSGVELMRQLAAADKPFFLAVGFKKPHLPFIAPKKYWDLYARESFPLAAHQEGIANDSGYVLHNSEEFRGYEGVPKEGAFSEDFQRECIHGYFACTSFIDAQVGLLMKELEALRLRENTIIVLWGDHGWHLGDHGMWGKHSTLEQATRAPLIIAPPGGSSVRRTARPVEFTDLFPTLCDLAAIPAPPGLSGRSLVPLLSEADAPVREGALTVFKKSGAYGYSYRTTRYRYTEWINKSGRIVGRDLFDYESDPLETENLANDPGRADLIDRLAASLRRDAAGCDRLHQK